MGGSGLGGGRPPSGACYFALIARRPPEHQAAQRGAPRGGGACSLVLLAIGYGARWWSDLRKFGRIHPEGLVNIGDGLDDLADEIAIAVITEFGNEYIADRLPVLIKSDRACGRFQYEII